MHCRISGNFNLDLTDVPEIDLTGSRVEKVSAEYASIKGCIILKESFHSTGPIELSGAQIGGTLECDGGKFENPPRKGDDSTGTAINGENARITGDVPLRNRFSAKASVWVNGRDNRWNLECWGSSFENPEVG